MESVVKICPSPEDLSKIENLLNCTEPGCKSVFHSKSNLTMHVVKHHRSESLLPSTSENVRRQYYCPVSNCNYFIDKDSKCFGNLKSLKQHYIKVHAEKMFACEKCDRKFPTKAICWNHQNYCGTKFTCLNCDSSYNIYEALLTHTKRKNHRCLEKSKYLTTNPTEIHTTSIRPLMPKTMPIFILAKPSNKTDFQEIGIQTDKVVNETKKRSGARKKASQHTQTVQIAKNPTSTQTTGDYILKSAMSAAKIPTKDIPTMELPELPPIETLWKKDEENMKFLESRQVLDSSSQTPINYSNGFEYFMNQSYPRDRLISNNESRFCNIETQTDCNLENSVTTNCATTMTSLLTDDNSTFEPLLQTNMCTQTCNILLELGFNDIETQTVWSAIDDLLVSTETQTNLMTETNHCETQTDRGARLTSEIS